MVSGYSGRVNLICRTCGTTLHSGISRDYGQCGACRVTEDEIVAGEGAADEKGRRVSPWHEKDVAPDKLRG